MRERNFSALGISSCLRRQERFSVPVWWKKSHCGMHAHWNAITQRRVPRPDFYHDRSALCPIFVLRPPTLKSERPQGLGIRGAPSNRHHIDARATPAANQNAENPAIQRRLNTCSTPQHRTNQPRHTTNTQPTFFSCSVVRSLQPPLPPHPSPLNTTAAALKIYTDIASYLLCGDCRSLKGRVPSHTPACERPRDLCAIHTQTHSDTRPDHPNAQFKAQQDCLYKAQQDCLYTRHNRIALARA